MNANQLTTRIAELTAEMNKLRRANGTLPSLASNAGKRYATLELEREVLKHEVEQLRRTAKLTPVTIDEAARLLASVS
jgi:cell division protein FtsB